VNLADRVAAPPKKPLIIYDGECKFCCLLVERWRHVTGDAVQYLPSQNPTLVDRFPELQRERLEKAVHLVENDGSIFQGARAAFGALAHGSYPRQRLPLSLYQNFPAFAGLSEWVYAFIARHRRIFSFLVRIFFGRKTQPQSYDTVRVGFLRSLGLIYLIAFVSLWAQLNALVGKQGLLPVKEGLETIRNATPQYSAWGRFHIFPTLSWVNSSDAFLHVQCAAGTILAITLVVGIAPAACLFLLWLIYLSLATVHREFLAFQWDNLLLEAGFLAIFLSPLQLLPWKTRARAPSLLVIWLFRWLLFRLMFESGCVKLLSGDSAWRDLTALTAHFQTQPLPTWIAWYVHQLPEWLLKASTVVMFAIELVAPFLIFGPRRFRFAACAALFGLQVIIFLTGNYCFFNMLTMALCLFLLDDSALKRLTPSRLKKRIWSRPALSVPLVRWQWPRPIIVVLTAMILWISVIQLFSMFQVRIPWPQSVLASFRWVNYFRTFNNYGLFAVMTMQRPEIIVQGSNDGKTWLDYELKYKPGDVKGRPKFVAPYQPRLDWQMWFAALGNYRQNPWFINFCVQLLEGSPPVLHLLERNPFPKPPRYVRALIYEYHFTNWSIRRRTGAWWQREVRGVYLPVLALQEETNQKRAPTSR
jgi:lipase maturation factor 1